MKCTVYSFQSQCNFRTVTMEIRTRDTRNHLRDRIPNPVNMSVQHKVMPIA